MTSPGHCQRRAGGVLQHVAVEQEARHRGEPVGIDPAHRRVAIAQVAARDDLLHRAAHQLGVREVAGGDQQVRGLLRMIGRPFVSGLRRLHEGRHRLRRVVQDFGTGADIAVLLIGDAVIGIGEGRLRAAQKRAVDALPGRHLQREVDPARGQRLVGAGAQRDGVVDRIAAVVADHRPDERVLPGAAEARIGLAGEVRRARDPFVVAVEDQPPRLVLHRRPERGDVGPRCPRAHEAQRGHVGEVGRAGGQQRGGAGVGIGQDLHLEPGLVVISVLACGDQTDMIGVQRPVEGDGHLLLGLGGDWQGQAGGGQQVADHGVTPSATGFSVSCGSRPARPRSVPRGGW